MWSNCGCDEFSKAHSPATKHTVDGNSRSQIVEAPSLEKDEDDAQTSLRDKVETCSGLATTSSAGPALDVARFRDDTSRLEVIQDLRRAGPLADSNSKCAIA